MKLSKIEISYAKINGLVERCKHAKTSKDLFPLLLECARWILSNPALIPILKIIRAKEEAIKKQLNGSEEAASEELESKHTAIREYAISQKVIDQKVIEALDTFQDRFKKSPKADQRLFSCLDQAIRLLLNNDATDHSSFLEAFGRIKQINAYRFIDIEEAFPLFHAWENACVYFAQEQQIADWHSLNQIIVFVERFDFYHYDQLVTALIKDGLDPRDLQEEHRILMKYALSGEWPSEFFPSIGEYKSHVMRLAESIIQIMADEIENGINEKKDYKRRISGFVNVLRTLKEISGLLKWIGGVISAFIYIWNCKIKTSLISAIWK